MAVADARTGDVMAELRADERILARKLWEEVFEEDTEKFLNYYDGCVADHNHIFGEKEDGELVSMVQLNPYRVRMGEQEADSYYIVAVATRESCRHQGRMRGLLKESMQEMYQEKIPFTFLMPASESIYLPFDFVTVYRQSMLSCGSVMKSHYKEKWKCIPCDKAQLGKLAEWSNTFLKKHSDVSTVRTESYYQRIWKEQASMNGQILLLLEGEKMKGYCFTGYEGSGEAWEIATGELQENDREGDGQASANQKAVEALTDWFARKDQLPMRICGFLPGTNIEGIPFREISYRPMTMVRIIHLEEFVRRMRATEELEFDLKITDPLIPENNGTFRFSLGKEHASLTVTENSKAPKMTIAELTEAIFGKSRTDKIPQKQIQLLNRVYLNEIV